VTHVSLFTGIGGLDLAAEAAGFETVLQVEREPYALQILERHWPKVPRITDVREVASESVSGHVTVISGGFPCQPFSAAGKRRGTEDDRYLWPELLRIVEELRPSWVVGENVSGLLSIRDGVEIDEMLASLEARNYTPWILHYPAAGVGAPHRRDRVFIVANSSGLRRDTWRSRESLQGAWPYGEAWTDVADTERERGSLRKIAESEREGEHIDTVHTERPAPGWQSEPDVGRVAHGVPHRVDRLRALGNAVVPQQAYPIFAAIACAEAELMEAGR